MTSICPWKDCDDFNPLPEYKDEYSARLDLVNHIQEYHSHNQTAWKLVAEQQETIPTTKVKAFIKKLEESQRLIEWDYVDDIIDDLKELL